MFTNFAARFAMRPRTMMLMSRPLLASPMLCTPSRLYYKNNVLMPREQGDYYADPMDVSERLVRLIALHDNVIDPANVTLKSKFTDLGLNALDMCEIYIALEREFDLEISEEDVEVIHSV